MSGATRWAMWILITLAVFATGATLVGLILEKRYMEYGFATAIGYLSATLGFIFIVGWTYFKGHLDDVEAPKNKVLRAERDDA